MRKRMRGRRADQRRRLIRVFVIAGAIILILAFSLTPVRAEAAVTTRRPVIFVHGWNGSAATWTDAVARFRAAGYQANELWVWTYPSWQSNVTTAAQFERYLNQVLAATGWNRADVVTHSMGGLSTGWCIKFGGCANKIDDWISLGGPNHGTTTAMLCATAMVSCAEMSPGSSFLSALNSGDPTPGTAVTWSTWRSPCDLVVWPSSSTALEGAINATTGCLFNTALTRNTTVLDAVIARVRD